MALQSKQPLDRPMQVQRIVYFGQYAVRVVYSATVDLICACCLSIDIIGVVVVVRMF